MPDTTVVKNIRVIQNNTKPVYDTIFPNIEYMESDSFRITPLDSIGGSTKEIRFTKISSRIPIIRGEDVYLILLVHRYEDDIKTLSRKKEYIQRFLQEANNIQQRYIVQNNFMVVDAFNQEQLIYKMEY